MSLYSKLLALPALLFLACNAPTEGPLNKFSDPISLKIADFEDRRMADSLYPYFHHPDARYRREAVEAFASIQETDQIDRIGKLLMMDGDTAVRGAAAFAIGQIAHPAAERLLLGALVKEKNPANKREILEAYGKVTARWNLDPQPFLDDTLQSAGLAWSLYRAGLRAKTDSVANGVAERLLASPHAVTTRLGAAHYFARGSKDTGKSFPTLRTASTTDPSPSVRMAAALALGKVTNDSSLATLTSIIANERDARVVINAVRALRNFPFDATDSMLYECLRHKDVHVGITASEAIRDKMPASRWIDVVSQEGHVDPWRIKANLLEGALRASRNPDLVADIQSAYMAEGNPYAKAALLSSLKNYPPARTFVRRQLTEADTAVIRSAAAETLAGMSYSENITAQDRRAFATLYEELIRSSDDPAVLGTIANALGDSILGFRGIIKDVSFLTDALSRLKLPQHIEAIQPIRSAIAYLEGSEPPVVQNEFNHPIDWDLVRRIPADLTVTIKTTRGDMIVRLFVDEAPGSVANFVHLAQMGYFNGRTFHRVVPNFVIQAGCNRGDGWGSEEYSIRSDFSPRRYQTGSVGMASAGKDTEGTQWFVTHSPTPHLDGRYTIFGEVIQGMKVVDYVQVGDKVTSVEIPDLKTQ